MANPMQLARRIDQVLRSRLGEGISLERMLNNPLYARDVLLVCDALTDTDAPVLARAYRHAAATHAEREARKAFDWPDEPSISAHDSALPEHAAESDPFFEFDTSHPPAEMAERARAQQQPRRSWFGRLRGR